jgi:hypothetical protein
MPLTDESLKNLPPEMIRKAVAIADQSMIASIEGGCDDLSYNDDQAAPGLYGLVDTRLKPVSNLCDADPSVVEAFWWLSQRKLATLEKRGHREVIALTAVALGGR